MSKTISVREAAAALGLTPRAVSYRLEKGQLKGTLAKNETTGVPEWRIYPNKEILAGLSQPAVKNTSTIDFEPTDVIDAESVDTAGDASSHQSEERPGAMDFQMIVEQCVRPLVEEVKAQALAIAERDKIIEDQNRHLRLLPDFEKRAADEKARAEEERKAAELRALEVEALNKQVAAMQLEQQQAEMAQKQVQELERTLSENQRKAEEEIERLKQEREADARAIEELKAADAAKIAEKEAEAAAIKEQLQLLSATVEELKKPKPSWWQKWFTAPQETP